MKVYLILLGALILFNVCFVSSKRYNFAGAHLTDKQYSSLLTTENTRIKALVIENFISPKTNKEIYLFGLPESTIYFIYSGYFLLFSAFVLTFGGSIISIPDNNQRE